MSQFPGLIIERARPTDASAFAAILADVWQTEYPNPELEMSSDHCERMASRIASAEYEESLAARIQAEANNQSVVYLAARLEEACVGFLEGSQHSYNSHRSVEHLNVVRTHRGKGIGTALLRQFFIWGGASLPVRLRVAVYTPALQFYRNRGFTEIPEEVPSGARVAIQRTMKMVYNPGGQPHEV